MTTLQLPPSNAYVQSPIPCLIRGALWACAALLLACDEPTPVAPAPSRDEIPKRAIQSAPSAKASSPAGGGQQPPNAPEATDVLSDEQFGRLVAGLSERERSFFSENLVSNEGDFLKAIPWLEKRRDRGGVFIGVGPEQNLTYVALLRPRFGFVVDIRRDNLLQHLLYKSAFDSARSREHWLATVLGRRLTEVPLDTESESPQPSVEEILRRVVEAPRDAGVHTELVERTLDAMKSRWRIPIEADDGPRLNHLCAAFSRLQLDVRFETTSARPDFPTLGQLLAARDGKGYQRSFLADVRDFEFVQRFERGHRLIPLVGDFAGKNALVGLARWLEERRLRVDVFYTSNVEQYLLLDGRWDQWLRNLRALPHDQGSLLLRSYSDRKRPLPGLAGGVFTPLGQSWNALLSTPAPDSYFDLAKLSEMPPGPKP